MKQNYKQWKKLKDKYKQQKQIQQKKMEIAASQLQARSKRAVAQTDIAKISKAKDKIGAAAK